MRPFLLCTLLVLAAACSKKHDNDKVPPAVQSLIDSFKCGANGCYASVTEYRMTDSLWHGMSIYVYSVGGPACDGFPLFFDANGNKLQLPKDYQISSFQHDTELIRTVWKCQ
ncbi:MAG: hypothetical protein JST68_19255 [Bacteroidetes bacterium]|nr:hypothetical protein [Bacteroidota bacterium]